MEQDMTDFSYASGLIGTPTTMFGALGRWLRKSQASAQAEAEVESLRKLADLPGHLLTDIGFRKLRSTDDREIWERDGVRLDLTRHSKAPDPIRA
jgi:hypothetical protein